MNINEKEENKKIIKKSSMTLTIAINSSANKCLSVAKMYCRTFPEWMRLFEKKTTIGVANYVSMATSQA